MIFGIFNLVVLYIITVCQGYIHLASMKIYRHDTNKTNSLFGYSLAYQSGFRRLIISSPLENENGQVFTMSLNSSKIETVSLDPKLLPRTPTIKHNFWLGATVKANSNFFVTCAPRYAELKTIRKPIRTQYPATLGLCVLFEYTDSDTYISRRLAHMSSEDRSIRAKTFGENLDSMGWSIDLANSGQVLIGSPAMLTGRVVLYEDPYSKDFPKLIYKMNQENIARHNYGYSLAIGEFFDQSTVYAISATFGFGKVYFFDSKLQNIGIIKDIEIGSIFGAALCPAHLGTKALLVGAPAYFDKTYNYDVGAVYVYLDQTEEGSKKMLLKRKIKGLSSGSYFGHAIASLGDIDGDNKDEIVVAAPFEDGIGAVYFFSGSGVLDGLSQPRKIQPKGFQSFGFSLTILEDLDGNGCKELAVGSPKDNKVVIFKTIAFIKVILKADLNQESDKEFVLTSCIDGVYPLKPENITADIVIEVKLKNAAFTTVTSKNGVYQYEVSMAEKRMLCKNFTLEVHEDAEKGFDYEIMSYEVTASLKEDPEEALEFDPSRVLLSDESVLKQQGQKWKDDTSLQEPQFHLNISTSMAQPYMIGSSYQETFTLAVLNEGGAAHAACMHLVVEGARVIAHPSSCRRELDRLVCRHNHVINTNDFWINEILIETDYLTSIHDTLTVRCDLYPQCGGKNVSSYEKIIELKPYNYMVVITGQSNPDEKLPITVDDFHTGKSFDHVYTIYNFGLTNWVGVQSEIVLQNSQFIDYSDAPIKVYAYTSLIECEIGNKNRSEEKIRVLCKIGDLGRQEKVVVVVAMNIARDTLKFDSEDQNITVTSSMELLLRDGNKFLSLNTTLTFEAATVPLWVTLASSFLGVFLLIIIAYILYEYGFLQRKTKEKLNETKKEVYRQSVRRSMMRESMRAAINRRSAEDNDILMEEVVQESDF
ncbi:integrin alpha-PS5-like [Danaus plexippus]|uniref:integrin alpha-PS5-like n=1 Tax=Danaus plexippus TaxID=13037 RepID=UPI002AB07881|nr:integrin alpha-PS5-like [Danaus plexippus]